MLIQVKSGTRAGWRIVRKRPDWLCLCRCLEEPGGAVYLLDEDDDPVAIDGAIVPRLHPGHRYSCPDCGMRRPA